MSDFNMIDNLNSILELTKSRLTSQTRLKPSSFNFEVGVGPQDLCKNNYTTPPLATTLTSLRSSLMLTPRPFPTSTQKLATSVALLISNSLTTKTLPLGASPLNPLAKNGVMKLEKRMRQSLKSAKFLLNQVGYRVPNCDESIEDLIVNCWKLLKAMDDYEGI